MKITFLFATIVLVLSTIRADVELKYGTSEVDKPFYAWVKADFDFKKCAEQIRRVDGLSDIFIFEDLRVVSFTATRGKASVVARIICVEKMREQVFPNLQ